MHHVFCSAAAPEWVEHINDTERDIGSDLYWPCVATGKPIPTIRWLKNGASVSVTQAWVVNSWKQFFEVFIIKKLNSIYWSKYLLMTFAWGNEIYFLKLISIFSYFFRLFSIPLWIMNLTFDTCLGGGYPFFSWPV